MIIHFSIRDALQRVNFNKNYLNQCQKVNRKDYNQLLYFWLNPQTNNQKIKSNSPNSFPTIIKSLNQPPKQKKQKKANIPIIDMVRIKQIKIFDVILNQILTKKNYLFIIIQQICLSFTRQIILTISSIHLSSSILSIHNLISIFKLYLPLQTLYLPIIISRQMIRYISKKISHNRTTINKYIHNIINGNQKNGIQINLMINNFMIINNHHKLFQASNISNPFLNFFKFKTHSILDHQSMFIIIISIYLISFFILLLCDILIIIQLYSIFIYIYIQQKIQKLYIKPKMGNQNQKQKQQLQSNSIQKNANNTGKVSSLKNSNIKQSKIKSQLPPNSPRQFQQTHQIKLRKTPQMAFKNKNSSTSNKKKTDPDLYRLKSNQSKISIHSSKYNQNNNNSKQQIQLYDDNNPPQIQQQLDNQFMPLIKLPQQGQLKLQISLTQLIFQSTPQPHLKKQSSSYNSILSWNKTNNNIFHFSLKQDQNYQLNIDVDIQGNTLNGNDQFWCALCPINIPIGKSIKIGQMTCANWYQKLDNYQNIQDDNHNNLNDNNAQQQEQQNQQLGPAAKNIDFKISQDIFQKWGQSIPKNFYDQDKKQLMELISSNKLKPRKLQCYRELSRYFDLKNTWRATTYYQQTTQHFKGWIIEVIDQNYLPTVSRQLHLDYKKRQTQYTKTIYQNVFNSVKSTY